MLDRRTALKAAGALTLGAVATPRLIADEVSVKAGLKQSVCRWCYNKIPIEKLAAECARLGYRSVELLKDPDEVAKVKAAGLTCAVYGKTDIVHGLNREKYHAAIVKQLR